jgi:DNA polymerase, archaea type
MSFPSKLLDKKNILQPQISSPRSHDAHDVENSSRRFLDLSLGLSSIKVDPQIHVLLSFDLEWSMHKDENKEFPIIAAGFCDTLGNRKALLLEDYLAISDSKEEAERKLIARITSILSKYNWSVGFYSTGIRSFNPATHRIMGKDSDLIQLHRRLTRYRLDSPVYISDRSKKPYLTGFKHDHNHIDAYNLFSNKMIKTSIYNNSYNVDNLETISTTLLSHGMGGKYKGLTGAEFELSTNIADKRLYVFRDAEILLRCIALNNYELFHVLTALSELTEIKFSDICRYRGVGRIWTDILDKLVNAKLYAIQSSTKVNDEYLFDSLATYYDKEKKFLDDPIDDDDDNEKPTSKEPRYIGGWIMNPKPGNYQNVTVFDVSSLYPTMIVNNNISFETVNCQCCTNLKEAQVSSGLFENLDSQKTWHQLTSYLSKL